MLAKAFAGSQAVGCDYVPQRGQGVYRVHEEQYTLNRSGLEADVNERLAPEVSHIAAGQEINPFCANPVGDGVPVR